MSTKSIEAAVNQQINLELYSAYVYLSMAAYFEAETLPGFALWMRVQSEEETKHAMKFFNFMIDSNARVELQAIAQPPGEFQSPLDVMQKALEEEKEVTASINKLYQQAVQEKDYPLQILLQWFITEQVEEEKSATQNLEQVKMVGANKGSLLLLDAKLGLRKRE